jgi:hypothetical protein
MASPRYPSDEFAVVSTGLGILCVLYMGLACLGNTPVAVHSFCGTCNRSGREVLQTIVPWILVACSINWAFSYWFGSKLAVAVARAAFLACAGMAIVSWGFVWGGGSSGETAYELV